MRLALGRGKDAPGQVGELDYSRGPPLVVVLRGAGLVGGQPAPDLLLDLTVRLALLLVLRPVRDLTLSGAVVLRHAFRTVEELDFGARFHALLAEPQLTSAFACICIWEG
jgi:hypothetical protein